MKKVLSIFLSVLMLTGVVAAADLSAFAAESDVVSVNVSGKYWQSEARSVISSVNSLRTGSSAWYWNESNSAKVKVSGLEKLEYDYDLEKVAMQRAAETALYFDHTRPNGTICFSACDEYGYTYWTMGENIAAGQTSASSVFKAWAEENENYAGQGHRRNMLNENFTNIGIGCFYYNGTYYWAMELAASYGGNTGSATTVTDKSKTVTVDIAAGNISSITFDTQENISVKENGTTALPEVSAEIKIAGGVSCRVVFNNVMWSVSSGIISVTNGKVKGNSAGNATLTAKVAGKKAKFKVTVSHRYEVVTKAKSSSKGNSNGKMKCSVCGATEKLYYPKTMSLSTSSYTYNAKAKKPSVTVKDSKGNKISSKYYTVSYISRSTGKQVSSMKNPGKYYVKVTFKTRYSGSIKKAVTIKPKKTSIKKITASKKGFTVKWGKVSTQNTGYQVQYSTNKKFKKNVKSATVSKTGTTSKKISGLSAKKKYYVRVRTYKTVKINGKNTKIYSAWSSAKAVTTKK